MIRNKEIVEELRTKIILLRDKGMLPKGYAKIVGDKIGCIPNKVYQTFTGNNSDLGIFEAIIDLAAESKEQLLLEKVNKLLEEEN